MYATEAYYTGPDSRVRRFEYRKDGFVSVRGGGEGGDLLTKPIQVSQTAESLVINFQTEREGEIQVGIETPDGKAIPGFEPVGLNGDSINRTVQWLNGDIASLIVACELSKKIWDVPRVMAEVGIHGQHQVVALV